VNPFGIAPPPATESEFFNAARPTVFLLVEGNSDERFWQLRVDRRRCQIRAMGGRDKAVEELEQNRRENRLGFVAVLDADFDRIDGTLREDPDIVYTEYHDLECVLVGSPALEKVLGVLGSSSKCAQFEHKYKPIRDVLLENARVIGELRWLSKREGLNLVFRKRDANNEFRYIGYKDFCEQKGWSVDPRKLVAHVCNFSMRHDLKLDDLLDRSRLLPAADAWQICVGHDLLGLLAIGLRQALGNATIDTDTMQDSFLLAYEDAYLKETLMYRALCVWEENHRPFRIFR
jgi:hypothetical protein